jgi:hypothetical protein
LHDFEIFQNFAFHKSGSLKDFFRAPIVLESTHAQTMTYLIVFVVRELSTIDEAPFIVATAGQQFKINKMATL